MEKIQRVVVIVLIVCVIAILIMGVIVANQPSEVCGPQINKPTTGPTGLHDISLPWDETACTVIIAGKAKPNLTGSLFWWVSDPEGRILRQNGCQMQGWVKTEPFDANNRCFMVKGVVLPPGRYVFNIDNTGAERTYSKEAVVKPGANRVSIDVQW